MRYEEREIPTTMTERRIILTPQEFDKLAEFIQERAHALGFDMTKDYLKTAYMNLSIDQYTIASGQIVVEEGF